MLNVVSLTSCKRYNVDPSTVRSTTAESTAEPHASDCPVPWAASAYTGAAILSEWARAKYNGGPPLWPDAPGCATATRASSCPPGAALQEIVRRWVERALSGLTCASALYCCNASRIAGASDCCSSEVARWRSSALSEVF